MTDVLIKRELLEDLRDAVNDCLNHEIMRGNDRNVPAYTELVEQADAALSAPRQPEGEGLEVVANQFPEINFSNYGQDEVEALQAWGFTALDAMADAQRAIAELRDRLDVMTQCADNYSRMFEESAEECERLRMQLAACGVVALANTPESASEARQMHQDYMSASCSDVAGAVDREMTLRQQLADVIEGNTKLHVLWTGAVRQRDKLAGLLADVKADYTHAIHWEDMHAIMKRIDAALAEIENTQ